MNFLHREISNNDRKMGIGSNKFDYLGIKIVLSLLMTVIFYLVYAVDLFGYANGTVEDLFFQQEKETSEEIVVIGVTAQDLEEYGMWPWDRTTWANVLSTINSSEETNPAAIGISVTFYGDSQPVSDELLYNEITKENVVLACTAEFKTEIVVDDNNDVQQNDYVISDISYPYAYPDESIQLGHANIIFDSDGILRRALLEIETETGGIIGSMEYETFKVYHEYYGTEAEFEPILDENGFWYVDYSASSGGYFNYSVSDILNGNYSQEDLTGKIVLIGVYDSTLMDYYRASIDHSENMYGVEFMANCLNAMINDVEIKEVDTGVEIAVLLISTFLITFLALHLKFIAVTIFTFCAAVVGVLTILYVYHNGILFSPFYYISGLVMCYILSVIFNYWFEWYTKKHVTDVFKQYVDPKVMEQLLQSKVESLHVTGKATEIAVLFVDLRGFTRISERLDAETIVKILNEFFTLADSCIREHGGTLDKFIGDCAMAFWGAPQPMKKPAYNACCAAIDMSRCSAQLSRDIYERYNVEISFGVGIHYGTAIVGNVGSSTRLDYTAIGDTVNTASRLESVAPPGKIYISEAVKKEAGNTIIVDKLLDKLQLKGKKEPMDIYVLKKLK